MPYFIGKNDYIDEKIYMYKLVTFKKFPLVFAAEYLNRRNKT